jgi:hypothetical protein
MLKKIFRYLSPCILVAIFCIIAIADGLIKMETSQGWSYLAVIILLPVLIAAIVIDIVAKIVLKDKLLYIWLIEILLLAVVYYFLVGKYV